jgi:hypothetical protein
MDDFQKFMADWSKRDAAREAKAKAEAAADNGCKHPNIPVKYDSADCAGKDDGYVRRHYPRFNGNCPDCGIHMIGYASFEHYIAGDW